MAEKKLDTGPEGQLGLGDVVKDEPGGGAGGPGDVEVSAEQIEALMAEKKAAERAALEQEGAGGGDGEKAPEAGAPAAGRSGPVLSEPDDREPWEKTSAELEAEKKPARRGRPPKAEREAPGGGEPGAAGKTEKGRAPKKGKGPQEQAKAPKKAKAPRAPKDKGGGGGPAAGAPPRAGTVPGAHTPAPPGGRG